MSIQSDGYLGLPGYSDAVESVSNEFIWGKPEHRVLLGGQISGAARDSGNTNYTAHLRPGLLLGQLSASPGLYVQYDPAATDGSQVVAGILAAGVRVTDLYGSNKAAFAPIQFAGPVKASKLYGLDAVARAQMRGRFLFDDDLYGAYQNYSPWLKEVAKTADYTVVAADAGTLFTTTGASGAVVFTLPTIAAGVGPFGFLNVVDQNMTIASAGSSDNIIAFNDAAADSIAFSSAGNKIGAFVKVYANMAGTKWIVENLSYANTITVA